MVLDSFQIKMSGVFKKPTSPLAPLQRGELSDLPSAVEQKKKSPFEGGFRGMSFF